MNMDYILLARYILYWFGFGAFHTVLTFDVVKQMSRLSPRLYRIIYNILQSVALFLVLVNVPSITQLLLQGLSLNGFRLFGFLLLFAMGGLIAAFGLWKWDLLGFLGLKEENSPLMTDGIYTFSRHPVYTGSILVFLSTLFVVVNEASLSWVLGAGGYFIIGSIFEEMKLKRSFENYDSYKERVAWIFPWKFSHYRLFFKNISNLI